MQSALAAECFGDAHSYILWHHPRPGDQTTAGNNSGDVPLVLPLPPRIRDINERTLQFWIFCLKNVPKCSGCFERIIMRTDWRNLLDAWMRRKFSCDFWTPVDARRAAGLQLDPKLTWLNFKSECVLHPFKLLARSFTEAVVVATSPKGCVWAPGSRERQSGSCSGPSPRPGAADLRGDESRGLPPPRRLPLPVTQRCWGKPTLSASLAMSAHETSLIRWFCVITHTCPPSLLEYFKCILIRATTWLHCDVSDSDSASTELQSEFLVKRLTTFSPAGISSPQGASGAALPQRNPQHQRPPAAARDRLRR